jgi:hypothetical protein
MANGVLKRMFGVAVLNGQTVINGQSVKQKDGRSNEQMDRLV